MSIFNSTFILGLCALLFFIGKWIDGSNTRVCPYCREDVKKGATVCPHCRKELPPVDETPSGSPSAKATDTGEGNSTGFALVILFIIAAAFFAYKGGYIK